MKVLLIQNYIPHYRVPIYNSLARAKGIELTIAHSGKLNSTPQHYTEIEVPVINIFGFTIHRKNLKMICNQFDVVIAMADIRWLSIISLGFIKRKFKLIYWGIGVTASYKHHFDEKTLGSYLRFLLMRRADALVFYSDYPVKKYVERGFDKNSLFVANNTVQIFENQYNIDCVKDRIVFIGSLYKKKLIYELLDAYLLASTTANNTPFLSIIGKGEEYENILVWLENHKLEGKVFLHGEITNEEELYKIFSKSYLTISPGQAGLSVLVSMGYGVPFVTRRKAITGGEIFNIIDNYNGFLYNEPEELVEIIKGISWNKTKYIEMGLNAYNHYKDYRLPKHMVNGFIEAINYVTTR